MRRVRRVLRVLRVLRGRAVLGDDAVSGAGAWSGRVERARGAGARNDEHACPSARVGFVAVTNEPDVHSQRRATGLVARPFPPSVGALMTQQIPDEFFDGDTPCRSKAILPLPALPLFPAAAHDPRDFSLRSTACWRRYVARWTLREGRLWLTSFRGAWCPLLDDGPLHAWWFTGVLRLLGEEKGSGRRALDDDDLIVDDDDDDDWPLTLRSRHRSSWRWRSCREVDIRAGCMVRERWVHVACDDESPIWEQLPGGDGLFANSTPGFPLSNRPRPESFLHRRLRRACWQARTHKHLSPGDAAVLLGESRKKGGRVCEWEAGIRDRPSEWVNRYAAALGIPADDVVAMNLADDVDARAADEAWLSAPVRPVLLFRGESEKSGRHFDYGAPPSVATGDEAAALAWARACIALTWRPAKVVVSRRVTLHLDGDGDVVDEATDDASC